MRRSALIFSLSLITSCAGVAQAQYGTTVKERLNREKAAKLTLGAFDKMDTDQSGTVSKDELPEGLQQYFEQMDKNGDGELGLREQLDAVKNRNKYVPTDPNTGSRLPQVTAEAIRLWDRDRNGELTKLEIPRALLDRWNLMDINNDGVIDEREQKALLDRVEERKEEVTDLNDSSRDERPDRNRPPLGQRRGSRTGSNSGTGNYGQTTGNYNGNGFGNPGFGNGTPGNGFGSSGSGFGSSGRSSTGSGSTGETTGSNTDVPDYDPTENGFGTPMPVGENGLPDVGPTPMTDGFGTPTYTEPGTKPVGENGLPDANTGTTPGGYQPDYTNTPGTTGSTPDGTPPSTGTEDRFTRETFESWDTNRDGKLNGEEIPERFREELAKADLNGDGVISPQEQRIFLALQNARKPGTDSTTTPTTPTGPVTPPDTLPQVPDF